MEKLLLVLQKVFELLIPYLKKEDSKFGVKETNEALIGVNEVSLVTAEILGDGIQYSDALDFYNKVILDDRMKTKLMAAYEGYEKIPYEIKDIDLGEGMELASSQLNYLPRYLDLFKKEK